MARSSSSPSRSPSNTDSDPYVGSETEPETDADDGSAAESEGELLRQRIEFHRSQGRSKSRRSEWSQSLTDREVEIWRSYCEKIGVDPSESLRACEPQIIKTYLEWRVINFRIKTESCIHSYWKRLSGGYIDLTGCRIANGTELDIRDWIPTYLSPTYKLITSEKDKFAMYAQDLYAILYAHWADDPKAMHGLGRVQFSLLLLLSAATATRPGALVESSSAKGTDKALSWEHITIMRVRDERNPKITTTAVKVDLFHIKNSGGKGRPKKFIFRLESTPAFCIVSHFLALALTYGVFRRDFTSVEEIFRLEIPSHRDLLRVKFKKQLEKLPVFRDFKKTPEGVQASERACPYHRYRDQFVWLGRIAGFEQSLELYQVRRASGRNINAAFTPEERNQTMGHHGSTYEQFYMPDLIERDFQSIYFGSPSQDNLIRSIARMGLSRDARAPWELTDEQKREIRDDPALAKLRRKRDRYKEKIYARGYRPLPTAKGTRQHDRYRAYQYKIQTMTNMLRKRRLNTVVREFHDTIDEIEIARQLDGTAATDTLIRPRAQYEHRERAAVVELMGVSLSELNDVQALRARSRFVSMLYRLCHRQESRRFRSQEHAATPLHRAKREPSSSCTVGPLKSRLSSKDPKSPASPRGREQSRLHSPSSPTLDHEKAQKLYPMKFSYPICLICIGREDLSYEKRICSFARKCTVQKHISAHLATGLFRQRSRCRHPHCSDWIKGDQHFKRHAADKHGVFY